MYAKRKKKYCLIIPPEDPITLIWLELLKALFNDHHYPGIQWINRNFLGSIRKYRPYNQS